MIIVNLGASIGANRNASEPSNKLVAKETARAVEELGRWNFQESKGRLLAGGSLCRSFFFGLFFLFFFLEFVADEFKDGDLGPIANAGTRGDDAGVTTGAIREFRGNFAKEFFGDARREDVRRSLAAGGQSVALTKGDEFFGDGARGLGTGQRGGNTAMLEKIGDEVAQGGSTVPRVAAEFRAGFQVSHDSVFSVKRKNNSSGAKTRLSTAENVGAEAPTQKANPGNYTVRRPSYVATADRLKSVLPKPGNREQNSQVPKRRDKPRRYVERPP